MGRLTSFLKGIGSWLDERVQIGSAIEETANHPVPRDTASWWYVFGSATLTVFLLQLVTGICLATVYVPSADMAWTTLEALDYRIPLGWFLRALHGWGSNFMVALMLVHMVQVFAFGAFKYPRELTWVVGVILLVATLGMAFTGQILRFDQDAYWGLGIGAAIAGRSPGIGPQIVHAMLGGPIIAGQTLSRFFALHVFVIPGLLLAMVGVHLLLVLKVGINEWPMPGRLVKRETYRREYEELVQRDGEAFFPGAAQRDLVFAGFVILSLVTCAAVLGPIGPGGPPDPRIIETVPRPDFFFLWLFALFALLPAWMETPLILVGPPLAILFLLLVPFLSGTGEKRWSARPGAMLAMLLAFLGIGTLTHLGVTSPWSPIMSAWSRYPTPPNQLAGRTPLETQGALLVQAKQCRNCHSLGGEGGQRGPALDDVATRLTRDQLIRQVLQGGGEMPAYGDNLTPPEVTALVAFLATLHPDHVPPARDSTVPAVADAGSASVP